MTSKYIEKITSKIKDLNRDKTTTATTTFKTSEIDEKINRKTRYAIWAVNALIFSISLTLIVIGVLYLTVYLYPFSFTSFSISLVAGLFIAIGVCVLFLCGFNLILTQKNRNKLVLVNTALIVILYGVILAIGIWGLYLSSYRYMVKESIMKNILQTLNGYDEKQVHKYETMKINWLQSTFRCCGLYSYQDWQSFYLYGGVVGAGGGPVFDNHPIAWVDKLSVNNNLPYAVKFYGVYIASN
jgi:hypothetical protein